MKIIATYHATITLRALDDDAAPTAPTIAQLEEAVQDGVLANLGYRSAEGDAEDATATMAVKATAERTDI